MNKKEFMSAFMLNYLDILRESGITNMYGAVPFIEAQYPELSEKQAKELLGYWMKTFSERKK